MSIRCSEDEEDILVSDFLPRLEDAAAAPLPLLLGAAPLLRPFPWLSPSPSFRR